MGTKVISKLPAMPKIEVSALEAGGAIAVGYLFAQSPSQRVFVTLMAMGGIVSFKFVKKMGETFRSFIVKAPVVVPAPAATNAAPAPLAPAPDVASTNTAQNTETVENSTTQTALLTPSAPPADENPENDNVVDMAKAPLILSKRQKDAEKPAQNGAVQTPSVDATVAPATPTSKKANTL